MSQINHTVTSQQIRTYAEEIVRDHAEQYQEDSSWVEDGVHCSNSDLRPPPRLTSSRTKQRARSRAQTTRWTTASGHSLRVSDMDDEHLMNTISLILRKSAQRARAEAAAGLLLFVYVDPSSGEEHLLTDYNTNAHEVQFTYNRPDGRQRITCFEYAAECVAEFDVLVEELARRKAGE